MLHILPSDPLSWVVVAGGEEKRRIQVIDEKMIHLMKMLNSPKQAGSTAERKTQRLSN